MDKIPSGNIHTISILVANKPGVLIRCAQIFARRGFNIDSLVVSPSVNPEYSRMTITAQGDLQTLDQIIKQTAKLVDVIHVAEHSELDAITREVALFKIKSTPQSKPVITRLVKKHHARIIDESGSILIIEQTGSTKELDEFEAIMKKYNVLEMVRSGKMMMVKGRDET